MGCRLSRDGASSHLHYESNGYNFSGVFSLDDEVDNKEEKVRKSPMLEKTIKSEQITLCNIPSPSLDMIIQESKPLTWLWDKLFCDEMDFLENVFYDERFRSLSYNRSGEVRQEISLNYLKENEGWAFKSIFTKYKFVTNVLRLYKAYLPRTVTQHQYPTTWDHDKQTCNYDRKISSKALRSWWEDYVKEMSYRYNSIFSCDNEVKGMEVLLCKIFDDCEYPHKVIIQLKPQVACKVKEFFDWEVNQVKQDMHKSFYRIVRPNDVCEDQQDFLNKYIERSFLPRMLGCLFQVFQFIQNHPSVILLRNQQEPATVQLELPSEQQEPASLSYGSYFSSVESPACNLFYTIISPCYSMSDAASYSLTPMERVMTPMMRSPTLGGNDVVYDKLFRTWQTGDKKIDFLQTPKREYQVVNTPTECLGTTLSPGVSLENNMQFTTGIVLRSKGEHGNRKEQEINNSGMMLPGIREQDLEETSNVNNNFETLAPDAQSDICVQIQLYDCTDI